MGAKVAIKRADRESLDEGVIQVLDLSGCLTRLRRGDDVILKPNLVTDKPEYIARGANTSIEVLGSLLRILSDHGCRVAVGESETGTPVKGRRLDPTWRLMGIDVLAKRHEAKLLNFSNLPRRKTVFPGTKIPPLDLPEPVFACELLINIPKIKTHKYATLTCSMKNLYGLLPEPRRIIYHRWLAEIIVELTRLLAGRTVHLVDGLIGMEGNGPLYGDPVELNLLLAGDDGWSIDRTVCDLVDINWERVSYLRLASRRGLSSEDIDVVGDSVEELRRPFRPVDFNLYRSFEKKLMETPLVGLLTSHWFQKNVSRHFGRWTERLRGGGYRWYLEED